MTGDADTKPRTQPMAMFRPIRADEIFHALDLMSKEGWAYSEADVRNFLSWEPEGNIVGEMDGIPIAYLTTISYGQFGWVGNVVVREDLRGTGLGRALVEAAEEYLTMKGAATTVLNAYVHTVEFYLHLGYRDKARLWVCRGAMHPRVKPQGGPDEPAGALEVSVLKDVSEVAELDSLVFGGDRRRVLARMIKLNPGLGRVLRENGKVVGYLLAKRWAGGLEMGPIICPQRLRAKGLRAMLDSIVDGPNPDNPGFMVVTGSGRELEGLLSEYGLSPGDMMVMMFRGKDPVMRLDDIVAIGALEKG
jgi:predicted N-acetyltransferase YhbS